jgi:hypothetical protein
LILCFSIQTCELYLCVQYSGIHYLNPYEEWCKAVYCILASCYIRLTLNICSFVRQCNTFTSYITSLTSGGEYSITTEDGRVRPKHVLIEFKKWMCYIDGQKNKYSM